MPTIAEMLASAAQNRQRGNLELAEQMCRQILQQQPDCAEALKLLGIALSQRGNAAEALARFQHALLLRPNDATIHCYLGNVLQQHERYEEAAASYRQALRINPDYVEARFKLACARLAMGDFERGWPDYEARWSLSRTGRRPFREPEWDGADLAGRTILVHAEQDLSDTIQFIRYAALVKQKGGRALVECQPALLRVLANADGSDQLVGQGTPLPAFEVHAPLLSLPGILHTDLANIPAKVPYLRTDPDLTERWRSELAALAGFKVGIAWQASPKQTGGSLPSIPLAMLAALAQVKGVQLVSLQRGVGAGQFNVVDIGSRLTDVVDAAAVMKNLDLVICCDSPAAHLAGALNVPVWVALPFAPDWRWLLQRQDSPWYPSMRLFRQRIPGGWDEVFGRMAPELEMLVSQPQTRDLTTIAGRYARAMQSHQMGNLDLAEQQCRQILQQEPGCAEALNLLGIVLAQGGKAAEAVTHFQQALQLNPNDAAIHGNLGSVLQQQERYEDATACYRQALRINSNYLEVRFKLACVLLLTGDFERGWPDYEARWILRRAGRRAFREPTWDGANLAGRTILVHAEQGLGDTIQFIRYAALVKQRGGRVVVECQPALLRLLATADGIDQLVGQGIAPPAFDVQVALLSLPGIVHTTLATIPARVPYLRADPALVEKWRQALAAGERRGLSPPCESKTPARSFLVGIAWQGNPKQTGDPQRSILLAMFAGLARVKGVQLVSLQKGPGAEQLDNIGGQFSIVDVGSSLTDLMDTAAVMQNLDLVISSDTAVAHLAGALNVPVWVALPFTSDWRWLLHRQDSPWYPSMRLFRQQRPGDWDEVFGRMAAELERLVLQPKARDRTTMPTIAEVLTWAMQNHQQGNLDVAEQLYRQILEADPGNADAHHLLGVAAYQKGQFDHAVSSIKRALESKPSVAAFRYNLGLAQEAAGRLAEAAAEYQGAVELDPNYTDAHNNLGNALSRLGQLDAAAAHFQQALRQRPDDAVMHSNLGNVRQEQERWDEAVACYRQALRLDPNSAEAHNNLGNALKKLGRLQEALACFRQALGINPRFPEAFNNLGSVLADLGLLDEAVRCYQHALEHRPGYARAHYNLGNAFMDQGRSDAAVASYRQALQFDPDFADACNNLGNALQEEGRVSEAIDCYRRALGIDASSAAAHNNMANALRDLSRFEEALACSRRAVELEPRNPAMLGELVHQLQQLCLWDDLTAWTRRLLETVDQAGDAATVEPVSPFCFLCLSTPTTAQQQLRVAQQRVRRRFKPAMQISQNTAAPKPRSDARIKVGYLSNDFHAHATAFLIAELLEKHDRERFSVAGYSYGADDGSPMRRRLVAAFDRFVDVRRTSCSDAARQIAADEVEILVDLKGYTLRSRTQILALRPAPIQVNYLGFPGTMGAPFIDYILVDDFVVPSDQQSYFTEKLVHLPGCYQVNDSQRAIAPDTPSRADCGLPQRGFVFCCFNNNYKITPAMFDVWMNLLKAVPDSILWLYEGHPAAPPNLRKQAEAGSVAANRLVFAPRLPLAEHLARHRLADLFLDTFPVNAHTTASDALWAGCPVLTLTGQTFIGRVAGSLLRALGLPELITTSLAEYEGMALRLARDGDLLQGLKARLAASRATSRLFDAGAFAESLEMAYQTMWEIHVAGERPHAFAVNTMAKKSGAKR